MMALLRQSNLIVLKIAILQTEECTRLHCWHVQASGQSEQASG